MSERDPWVDRQRDDPFRTPMGLDEPDDPSASVFDRPTTPARPSGGAHGSAAPPPTRHQVPVERTAQYPVGDGWPGPAAPPQQPGLGPSGYGYPPDLRYPPGPPTPPGPGPDPRYPPPTRPRRPPEGPPGSGYGRPALDSGRRGRVRSSADADRGRSRREPSSGGGGRPGVGFPLGLGALVGLLGLAAFLGALLVLPWFESAGEEVTLPDIREAFEIPPTDPDSILPGSGDGGEAPLPGADGEVPTTDEVREAVEEVARDAAAKAAAEAIDTGKARYLELYSETLWLVSAVGVGLGVLFSTIL
ncbi:MAG TPA: hypothetical protein VIL36_03925, partial [Acidimicrobiales bacterium]